MSHDVLNIQIYIENPDTLPDWLEYYVSEW